MARNVEECVRDAVADCLAVDARHLAFDTDLHDFRPVDSLDVAELAARLEIELGVALPPDAFARAHTVGELAAAVRAARYAGAAGVPPQILARIRAGHARVPSFERSGPLTPYLAEELGTHALRSGRGALLDVVVIGEGKDAALHEVQARLGWLAGHGVVLRVTRARRARRERPAA